MASYEKTAQEAFEAITRDADADRAIAEIASKTDAPTPERHVRVLTHDGARRHVDRWIGQYASPEKGGEHLFSPRTCSLAALQGVTPRPPLVSPGARRAGRDLRKEGTVRADSRTDDALLIGTNGLRREAYKCAVRATLRVQEIVDSDGGYSPEAEGRALTALAMVRAALKCQHGEIARRGRPHRRSGRSWVTS